MQILPWTPLCIDTRGGRAHFFRLWLRSSSKFLNPVPDSGPSIIWIWESDSCSDSGYNHRSNRNLPQIPATPEIEKWLRIQVRFFTNFWLRFRIRKKNAESCRPTSCVYQYKKGWQPPL